MAKLKNIDNLRVVKIVVVNKPGGDEVIYDADNHIDHRATSQDETYQQVKRIAARLRGD